MKKIIGLLFLLLIFTGCSSTASSGIETIIEHEPQHKEDILQIYISDNGDPLTGLVITGVFEMVRMDHGVIEHKFTEINNGVYEVNLHLPMAGEWLSQLTMSNGVQTFEHLLTFEIPSEMAHKESPHPPEQNIEGVISTINGEEILGEDLEFYHFINVLQIALYRKNDKERYEGKELEEALKFWEAQEIEAGNVNTLLTQIIRLRAVALLAIEKGHITTQEEVAREIAKAKDELTNEPVAIELIQQYGEDRFWEKQQNQYQLIVLSQKVQQDMIDKVRDEHPTAVDAEINYLAHQEYEELLTSQVESLDIQIYLQ
ncbi:FixH family protein [Alkalihalobacterium sp. APHAB7]|uniref:FixH family protein n=1 Tax=Alkalihalobacterium sp. APHAB7 TaxID=3402081 RepID=UPI003AACFA0C